MSERSVVYIVDDDEAVRDSLRLLLEMHGFTTRTYASGAAFLHELPMQEKGCLLIDVNMPGVGGIELLSQLRAREMMMPVIVMTGGPIGKARPAAERAGATLLEKPFRPDELMNSVRKAMGCDSL